MIFLANENFPFPSIKILQDAGFVVLSVAHISAGISDKEIIDWAVRDNLVILTFDKDYGELIFRYQTTPQPPAVIFFRYKGFDPLVAGTLLLKLLQQNIHFEKRFSVVEENNIRQRNY